MREDFLQYLWRLARFDLRELRTTEGERISIQDFGVLNRGAGPDFGQARVRVAGMQWAGQVEVHVSSSEWYAHGHQEDPRYDSVILHVVHEEDRPVFRRDGSRIPCLELRGRIPPGLMNSYWRLMHQEHWVPCMPQLHKVGAAVRTLWLERLAVERLEERSSRFLTYLEDCGNDWEAAFYRSLARSLGGRVNGEAMEMLAASLPLRVLQKHRHSLLQLEALLFGQSGLIPKAPPQGGEEAAYVSLLRREYQLLRAKYDLLPLPVTVWRYLRLRPGNFPTVRIAQLATLLYRSAQLFGKSLAAAGVEELRNMFEVQLSNYWTEHHRFGGRSKRRSKRRLGSGMVDNIIINTIVPAQTAYGLRREDDRYRRRALDLLQVLPPETNSITRGWRRAGVEARSAAESQALLQLKQDYCSVPRCTECAIGHVLLSRPGAADAA